MDKVSQSWHTWYNTTTMIHLTRTLKQKINYIYLNNDPSMENNLEGYVVLHVILEHKLTGDRLFGT